MDWVCVAKNRDHWSALVETMELLCSINAENFLSFSGRTLLCVIIAFVTWVER